MAQVRNNHSLIKTLIFEISEKIKSAPSKKLINILLHSEFGHLLLDIWCKGCSLQDYTTFPISFLAGNAIRRPHLCQKGWLASAKLRSLVEIILARPIRGQDFNFSFNVIFLSTTDVNYVGHEVNSRPALQDVDQHV